jgi:intein/homing endonuclease
MVELLKDAGEKYIKDWLLEVRDYDEDNNAILNLECIYSIGLLEELIKYNRKGNFDRCLKKGSLIQTDNGWEKVEILKVGDNVLTAQGEYKKISCITSNFFRGQMVKLDTTGSYEIAETTYNHPILTASTNKKKHSCRIQALKNIKYKQACELKDKYQFNYVPKRKNLKSSEYSEDTLYLIGWVLADGYVNKKTNKISICLQLNQECIANKLMLIIDSITEGELGKEYNNRVYQTKPCQKVVIKTNKEGYVKIFKTSKILTDLLISSGCEPNNKKITKDLYNCNNLMPLVIGYLEGDGHQKNTANYDGYKREVIECATIYETLIKQIRQILIDNGIWSSIRFVSNKNRYNSKPQYSIAISGYYINKLLSFYKSLKFVSVNSVKSKELQYEVNDGFWTPIKKIDEYFYEGIVYNFEVEDNHTYIANGVTTHNCMALMMCMFQVQEDELGKVYNENSTSGVDELVKALNNFYKRN